ncbi:MAG: hypothetical protein IID60_06120 [Proteobacteria bacterium]|nr:hypothetical protein [Pseudomonadota bacterium]
MLLAVILSSLTSVDRVAEADHKALFQRALITFALARTLNGVISAVQGTELALQPAGVGVTLTPGEILDPVNDLVERFSWIMLGATLSLGIQQVFLDVGQWWGFRVVVAVLGLLWFWARMSKATRPHSLLGNCEQTLLRVFIIVFFLRFAVPVALIANEALYGLFLETRYQQSAQVIETAGTQIEKVSARPLIEEPGEEVGLIEKLERALDSTRQMLDFRRRVEYIKQRAAEAVEHMIQLSVVFILQTAILPIAFLWLFLQLLKQLFRGGWLP